MSAQRSLPLPLVALAWSLVTPSGAALGAELLMFREDACPYCREWEQDVGTVYPRTEEADIAPLRRVDIHGPPPGITLAKPVRYTPTFVLVEDGREIGRISGYPGEAMFWWRLDAMLEQVAPTTREEESS